MEEDPSGQPRLTEAVVLAGGLGTRLRERVSDRPKPMAPVAGVPFLAHQISWLARGGIERAILSVGFKHETIHAYFGDHFQDVGIIYSVEETPLGTGGGTRLALDHVRTRDVVLVNGDTFFAVDLASLHRAHRTREAMVTLAVRHLDDTARYGRVELEADGFVRRFTAPQSGQPGTVNGGVYVVSAEAFRSHAPEGRFSLEDDFLAAGAGILPFYGRRFDGYFIDIGTPDDFERAQTELRAHL